MSWLQALRLVGFVEGCSFLLLLLVAMPLKYLAGEPRPVQVVGAAHGGLWVLFVALAVIVGLRNRWPFGRHAFAVAASVLPGGPFLFDRTLKREAVSRPAPTSAAAP
jgi:integral membrane protein